MRNHVTPLQEHIHKMVQRGYYMAGVIEADQSRCKCGGKFHKVNMGKHEVPLCSICSKEPDKYRIRRVLPGSFGERAKRIEIRYDNNQQRLTDIHDAISAMKQIDKEILSGKFDPSNWGSEITTA